MQARRENASYVEMVETGKKLDKIEERKRKRGGGGNSTFSDDNIPASKKQRGKKKYVTPMDESDKSAKLAVLGGLV